MDIAVRTRRSRRVLALAAATIAVGGVLTSVAFAAPSAAPPVANGGRYLALGDSVPFGFREANTTPTPDYTKPKSFVGFPEVVASDLHLKLTNAACPGETTSSMINVKSPTNGCERGQGNVGPGYRSAFPLHVAYPKSQLSFAIQWLKDHRRTQLVSLMIGANDGFLCQETTPDHCTSPTELTGVLKQVSTNVNTILERLRRGARYTGQLVVVNYYSLDYSDPNQTALSKALDQVIDASAKKWNAKIAPGFAVFQRAAAQAGGNSCTAGLLTMLTGGGCGVHPSRAGQTLLATSVEKVVKNA